MDEEIYLYMSVEGAQTRNNPQARLMDRMDYARGEQCFRYNPGIGEFEPFDDVKNDIPQGAIIESFIASGDGRYSQVPSLPPHQTSLEEIAARVGADIEGMDIHFLQMETHIMPQVNANDLQEAISTRLYEEGISPVPGKQSEGESLMNQYSEQDQLKIQRIAREERMKLDYNQKLPDNFMERYTPSSPIREQPQKDSIDMKVPKQSFQEVEQVKLNFDDVLEQLNQKVEAIASIPASKEVPLKSAASVVGGRF